MNSARDATAEPLSSPVETVQQPESGADDALVRRQKQGARRCLMLLILAFSILTVSILPSRPAVVVSAADMTNSIGMRFREIPKGQFLMGAIPGDSLAEPDELPQHPVTISQPFLIGQFEVSQAEFREVVGSNPSWFQPGGGGDSDLPWWVDSDDLPVEMVSWSDAMLFCRILSERPEEIAAGRTYRLPTEAEWEYACRAGTTTRFHFGERFHRWAANMGQMHDHPLPRGSYPANRFGLHDMHGNVLEWCSDWHSDTYYSISPEQDPRGPDAADADHHVLRGGGWAFTAASCSFRDRILTHMTGASHGFRVVCELRP
jgi:formylglycine-generating enzyme required for sulfatase activity